MLEGEGTYRFGAESYPIKANDVLAAPTGGAEVAHQIVNTGATPLKYLGISANSAGSDVVEYPELRQIRRHVALRLGHRQGWRALHRPRAKAPSTTGTASEQGRQDWVRFSKDTRRRDRSTRSFWPSVTAARSRSTSISARLAAILDEDVAFLQKNGITHELTGRTLRVSRNRSPIVTVHFEPDKAEYQVTFMVDGSRSTATATAECARAVGKMLFSMTIAPK